MDKELYWDILDKKRKDLLLLLKSYKDSFYLAGGTALALQLGHRDSIDFDFFSPNSFSTEDLFKNIQKKFSEHPITKTQEEKDSLTLIIDNEIKISFFAYPYKLIKTLLDEDNFMMATIEDIGAMKLSAITSRSSLKDYVDLYFILHRISLESLLKIAKQKFPTIDTNPILKSLVYFEDIEEEPILFQNNCDTSFALIKTYLVEAVKGYLSKINK